LLREQVITSEQVKKHPYFADLILLEFMDAIWINEIYRTQRNTIVEIAKKEIEAVHTLERMEELHEKKETFRKMINLVNQMEFNL